MPVPVLSNKPDAAALDLSYSSLRSTSAMCIRYYLNRGVRAKIVVALLHHGEMWGAIICQQETPKFVSYETRMACETTAHAVSVLLHSEESVLQAHLAVDVRHNVGAVIQRVSEEPSWAAALTGGAMNCMLAGARHR